MNNKNSQPTREQIAARAHELFVKRGCQHGHAAEDWFKAEAELMELAAKKASAPASSVSAKTAPAKGRRS